MRFSLKPTAGMFLNWRGYVLGLVLVGLATGLKYLAQPNIIAGSNSLLYILAIVTAAILYGLGPAILVSVLSVLVYAYIFLEPAFTFPNIGVPQVITLVVFLAVAVAISFLASSLRNKTAEALREITARKKSEAELSRYRDQLEEMVKERTAELENVNMNLKREVAERQKAEMQEKRYADELLALSRAATALVEFLPEGDVYQLIAEQTRQLIRGTATVIVNSFDGDTKLCHVQSVAGDQMGVSAFTEINGGKLQGLALPVSEEGKIALTSRKLLRVTGGLYSLYAGTVPQTVARQIEERFGIGSIYAMGCYREGTLYGSVNILRTEESDLPNKNIIETFIHQASTAIQVKKTMDELEKSRAELEIKVHERTRELEENEEKYRALVENASEAVLVFQDDTVKFFNYKALEIAGYSREKLLSMKLAELIYPDDLNPVMMRRLARLQGKEVPASYEFRIVRQNGDIIWVNINAVLIKWEGKPAILGLATDITDRKNLEQELQAYARKITQVQEEERKRIAYELHDDTAQYLSILKLQLDSLLQSGKIQDPQILQKLQFLDKDAGRAVDDVRRYSHELRPGVLEYLGLKAALEQIAEDINKLQQITVEVEVEGEEQGLTEDMKLGFFRIAQEAINNARKHSRSSRVTVSLKYSPNRIQMMIHDNGMGFDIQKAKAQMSLKGSLGLMSMQERAKLIGAALQIESQIGQGTTITVEMPL